MLEHAWGHGNLGKRSLGRAACGKKCRMAGFTLISRKTRKISVEEPVLHLFHFMEHAWGHENVRKRSITVLWGGLVCAEGVPSASCRDGESLVNWDC